MAEKLCLDENSIHNVQNEYWKYEKNESIAMCQYYIKRKQRYCRHRVADGNQEGFCSDHTQQGLLELRNIELNSRRRFECHEIILSIIDQLCDDNETRIGQGHGPQKRKRERNKRISAPKRMANPFSVDLSPDLGVIDLSKWFTTPNYPTHIDIGCAKGRCIERLSQREQRKHWNHLGVEIRPATVNEAIERVNSSPNYQLPLHKNLHFLACNFVASIDQLLSAFTPNTIRLISIQFPDPWRRKKHLKRMLVQEGLVAKLSGHLSSGAYIYLSSDSNRVILWMIHKFIQNNSFKLVTSEEIKSIPNHVFLSSSQHLSSSRVLNRDGEGCDVVEKCMESVKEKNEGEVEVEDENDNDDDENDANDIPEDENDLENEKQEIDRFEEYWIDHNPFGELSERELICEVDWRRVKRCVLVRN